jgi:predicted transcriptional regulator
MAKISIRLPDELAERLRQAARERRGTPSDVVREALASNLDGAGPSEMSTDDVLRALEARAGRGEVGAARELLRHRRWEQDRRRPRGVPWPAEEDSPLDRLDAMSAPPVENWAELVRERREEEDRDGGQD